MGERKNRVTIFLFMYSIATTAIVYQNYIFIANLFKKYRAFEWLCKNEKKQITDHFFLCIEQENYIQFLLVTGFIVQFLSGSIGSILIKIFSKKKFISKIAFIFLLMGWIVLSVSLSYSKFYMEKYVDSNEQSREEQNVEQYMEKIFKRISFFLNVAFMCFGIGSDNSYLPIIYYINEKYPVDDEIVETKTNVTENKLNMLKNILRNKNYILISTMSSLAVLSLFVGNVLIITLNFFEFENNVIVILMIYIMVCIIPSFFISNLLDKHDHCDEVKKVEEERKKSKYIRCNSAGFSGNKNPDKTFPKRENVTVDTSRDYTSVHIYNLDGYDVDEKKSPPSLPYEEGVLTNGRRVGSDEVNRIDPMDRSDARELCNEKKENGNYPFKSIDWSRVKKQVSSPFYAFIVVEFFTITFSICFFMFSLFDIYENNAFGNTLNVYSLILPSSFIITLVFGIIADVIGIYNFVSFNLVLGIAVFLLIWFYHNTRSVVVGYLSLIVYFFHQSFFANHMYMYMSTVFKEENFSVLIGIINTFASVAFFLSFKIYEYIKYQKNSVYSKITTEVIISTYVLIFLFHTFYIKRSASYG
ncbi:major facilitator superfamily-related transporter, putative [Plasmodium ovale]|nr:major facilitator superfamily-related transporter, putative [Plasmodium ovale]